MIYNHITVRVPARRTPKHFLINPSGCTTARSRRQNLVKIDLAGKHHR